MRLSVLLLAIMIALAVSSFDFLIGIAGNDTSAKATILIVTAALYFATYCILTDASVGESVSIGYYAVSAVGMLLLLSTGIINAYLSMEVLS